MNDDSKFNELYALLDEAQKLAGEFTGGYSDHFFSAEEFHTALVESISKLKAGDKEQLQRIHLWFLPTSDWDDFTHFEGEDLGNRILSLLSKLTSNTN